MPADGTPGDVALHFAAGRGPFRWALLVQLRALVRDHLLTWSEEDRIEAAWRARRNAETTRNLRRRAAWSRRSAALRIAGGSRRNDRRAA